ncbi:hypothetical protein QE152_g6822 [Popillia japonica]|uniref:Uncharacterized protein n=1 Tax=Popillia japonica TaxID=7064 RepID=A0AAW1ME66_POPJA
MTSVTNQYETPTASIFDNNSVQREDEEIAHFHKLTQQIDVTKSTTEDERFVTKSGEDLENFDPSQPSITMTSVTNQYETPTASIFDNNSVQREDEEIAHFHKLTQQVTTSYLGDQTEASTVQDKTANSDPTDASIEDINNGNKFGQTTIVDVN